MALGMGALWLGLFWVIRYGTGGFLLGYVWVLWWATAFNAVRSIGLQFFLDAIPFPFEALLMPVPVARIEEAGQLRAHVASPPGRRDAADMGELGRVIGERLPVVAPRREQDQAVGAELFCGQMQRVADQRIGEYRH